MLSSDGRCSCSSRPAHVWRTWTVSHSAVEPVQQLNVERQVVQKVQALRSGAQERGRPGVLARYSMSLAFVKPVPPCSRSHNLII